MLSSIRFRYDRWRGVREASRGLGAPTATERALIDELRRGCAALPVERTDVGAPTAIDWATAMNRLRSLVLTADPRAFLRWDVIIARTAVRHSPVTPIALAELRARHDWETRWMPALRESGAGRPFRYAGHPDSSEPLIQIAPFSLLQRYYLRSAGIMHEYDDRVMLTSDVEELEGLVRARPRDARALFVAWWSLSETPLAERIGAHWIAYQERYGEVDNVDYFTNHWVAGPRRARRDSHRAGDHFLVGGSLSEPAAASAERSCAPRFDR